MRSAQAIVVTLLAALGALVGTAQAGHFTTYREDTCTRTDEQGDFTSGMCASTNSLCCSALIFCAANGNFSMSWWQGHDSGGVETNANCTGE